MGFAAGGNHLPKRPAERDPGSPFFQRQWAAKLLAAAEIEAFRANCRGKGYTRAQILAHDGYLINLGHPEKEGLAKSRVDFVTEMRRCEALGIGLLNFHPGSHLHISSEEDCLDQIAESIDIALAETEGVIAVIENTAGQGSNLGFRFEQIARLIGRVKRSDRVGALPIGKGKLGTFNTATRFF